MLVRPATLDEVRAYDERCRALDRAFARSRGACRNRALQRGSSGGSYNPLSDSRVLLLWHAADPAVGDVATWTDRVSGVVMTQISTAHVTKSATSFNSAYPGVFADGSGHMRALATAIGSKFNTKTQVTFVAAMQDTDTGTTVPWAYPDDALLGVEVGSMAMAVNDGGASRLAGYGCGGGGNGAQRISDSLATPKVVSFSYDLSLNNAIAGARVNGAAASLTSQTTLNTGGALGSKDLDVFALAGPLLGWIGGYNVFAFYDGIDTTTAAYLAFERWVGQQAGITW